MDCLKELGIRVISMMIWAHWQMRKPVFYFTGEACIRWATGLSQIWNEMPEVFWQTIFNLPAITGAGWSSSIGVNTGHVINVKHSTATCVAFLKVFSTQKILSAWHSNTASSKGVVTTENADALMVKMMDETLAGTGTVVTFTRYRL